MNRWVEQHVMGCKIRPKHVCGLQGFFSAKDFANPPTCPACQSLEDHKSYMPKNWNPSTNIADAMEVVDQPVPKDYFWMFVGPTSPAQEGDDELWDAGIGSRSAHPAELSHASADTLPLAICRAALLAAVKEESDE